MKSGTQDTNEAYVFQVAGHLYSNKDREGLHTELEERIIMEGFNRGILDFSNAKWFGAPILNEIIISAQLLHKQGGELIIVGSTKIDRIITAAPVDRVKLFANVQCALASSGVRFAPRLSFVITAIYGHVPGASITRRSVTVSPSAH